MHVPSTGSLLVSHPGGQFFESFLKEVLLQGCIGSLHVQREWVVSSQSLPP